MKKTAVTILGGGLTGLTTAYRLTKMGYEVVVIESASRCGGVIKTVKEDGFLYETGPNTGILGTPELVELIEDLGSKIELQVGDNAVKRRLILKKGKWEPLPSGPVSAIKTPLFRFRDKIRILGEPFRKRGTDKDETLDKLVLRRMGKSFLDYAIDPFILGVYAGDPSRLVTRYAFPKLYALEQNYGSFIGGTMKKRKEGKSEREAKATREVFSFKDGLEQLPLAMEQEISTEKILKSFKINSISGLNSKYLISGEGPDGKEHIESEIVISSLNAPDLNSELLPFVDSQLIDSIKKVQYAPTVEVILGFKKWQGRELNAFGGLIPHKEGRDILGVLFLSAFLPDRAPDGGALLTIFMGGVRNSKWIEADDQEVLETIENEIKDLMDIDDFNPDLVKIFRHRQAIPQYSYESEEKMASINSLENAHPGLIIGGNALSGIGIADRVKQGFELADRAVDYLENK